MHRLEYHHPTKENTVPKGRTAKTMDKISNQSRILENYWHQEK